MRFTTIAIRIAVFSILTILTQVGGLVYLLHFVTIKYIDKRTNSTWMRRAARAGAFISLYCLFSFIIVPLLAKPFGRVPLPMTMTNNVRPGTIWTCLLNRQYVKPELRNVVFNVASEMSAKYPGTMINFLDANFPFFNKFPLLPHWSHNDGKKLDISFCYNDHKTGLETNEIPSPIGYGICEEPTVDEMNTAAECKQKGYWQYSMLKSIVPQNSKANFTFNEQKTKKLVELFASDNAIGKIFIEPHLVTRLHLVNKKIRFHGCHAVRHDDHIHVQLK